MNSEWMPRPKEDRKRPVDGGRVNSAAKMAAPRPAQKDDQLPGGERNTRMPARDRGVPEWE